MKMHMAVINVIMFIISNVGKIEISVLNVKELKHDLTNKKYNQIYNQHFILIYKTFFV